MERVITDLGELNAKIDEDRRKGIHREHEPVSPGSEVQVSLDDSKQWRSAKVLEAFGDRITARVMMVDGSELVRNNVAHEADPIVNTIQYRALWSDDKAPCGGIWRHSEDQRDLRKQMQDLKDELSDLKEREPLYADDATYSRRPGRKKKGAEIAAV